MNVTFGIMDPLKERVRGKQERGERIAGRALETVRALKDHYAL